MIKKHFLLFLYVASLECVKTTPPEIVVQIVQRYRAGDAIASISEDLHVSRATVAAWARREGVPLRKSRVASRESRNVSINALAIINKYKKIALRNAEACVAVDRQK